MNLYSKVNIYHPFFQSLLPKLCIQTQKKQLLSHPNHWNWSFAFPMQTDVEFLLNGKKVAGTVEPRTHLADFIREEALASGTHVGCEQGVCGACTVFVDGRPTRSCITLAAACNSADIRTVEGFDADPLMEAIRDSFKRHHGLQCGFCTPGMLTTAYDIIRRLPDAGRETIRKELSGNLCRCTGYVGIVKAIQSVIEKRRAQGITEAVNVRSMLGPAGAGHAQTQS